VPGSRLRPCSFYQIPNDCNLKRNFSSRNFPFGNFARRCSFEISEKKNPFREERPFQFGMQFQIAPNFTAAAKTL
jgi:hypothetical protein